VTSRPFYWSLRRELWENRAVFIAPLAAAAVVLVGFVFALRDAPDLLARLPALTAAHAAAANPFAEVATRRALTAIRGGLILPYVAAGAGVMVVSLVVAIFYALGALYNERRDRSILFWKSLPVSDRTAVLAKAAIPLVVLPLVASLIAIALQILMIAIETAVIAGSGQDPGQLWTLLDLPLLWLTMPYGLLCVSLWQAPVAAWLMLVSAFAKRTPILWAVLPPAAICLFELVALHSTHAWDFLRHRLTEGFDVGFSAAPTRPTNAFGIQRLDPLHLLTNPGLWGGLVVAAALLAACVWLRRRHDPI